MRSLDKRRLFNWDILCRADDFATRRAFPVYISVFAFAARMQWNKHSIVAVRAWLRIATQKHDDIPKLFISRHFFVSHNSLS
jgi:hypothetical protein